RRALAELALGARGASGPTASLLIGLALSLAGDTDARGEGGAGIRVGHPVATADGDVRQRTHAGNRRAVALGARGAVTDGRPAELARCAGPSSDDARRA